MFNPEMFTGYAFSTVHNKKDVNLAADVLC